MTDEQGGRDDRQLQELDREECLDLLRDRHFGRVALNDEAGPSIFPVNYVFDHGAVVFRTDLGTKLDAAQDRVVAGFEIDHVDEQFRMGWSVAVRGWLVEVTDPEQLERVRQLPLDPLAPGERSHYARIAPTSITGRRIPFPDRIPSDWITAASDGNVWYGRDGDDLMG